MYTKPKRVAAKRRSSLMRLGGTFTYARVGEPLFGEYKDFGDKLPPYEDIAKYVFYTETSHEFPGTTKKQNPAWDKKAGRIGEHAGRSYYLAVRAKRTGRPRPRPQVPEGRRQ